MDKQFDKYVGFINIEPKYIKRYSNCMGYYEQFIDNQYDNKSMILLASSTTAQEMIDIHKRWPKIIKGFGEIKCYDKWNNKPLKLKGLMQYWDVFKYAGEMHLPVYIHYSLNSPIDVMRLSKCLERFPQTTFVLCHCGMDEFQENLNETFYRTITLMQKYSNLWCDISYVALKWFAQNPMILQQLPQDRIILGSDINPTMYNILKEPKSTEQSIVNYVKIIDPFIHSDFNIGKLFQTFA